MDTNTREYKPQISPAVAQVLEGSRFGASHTTSRNSSQQRMQPIQVKAGGSRELPSAVLGPSVRRLGH
jgi:hypothetical protein